MGRRHAYRDQRTALWSLFSPSIFIWVLAIELRSWGWHSKHFYPLTHLTGPFGFLNSLLWCSKVTFESFTYNNSCCNLPLSPAISHRQPCLVLQGSVLVTNLFYSQHDAQSYIQCIPSPAAAWCLILCSLKEKTRQGFDGIRNLRTRCVGSVYPF